MQINRQYVCAVSTRFFLKTQNNALKEENNLKVVKAECSVGYLITKETNCQKEKCIYGDY
jgi:hypothetical protein